jgi:hypothetical protein
LPRRNTIDHALPKSSVREKMRDESRARASIRYTPVPPAALAQLAKTPLRKPLFFMHLRAFSRER